MTMLVVLGDGEAVPKEMKNHLANLERTADSNGCWFLIQSKDEPTGTDESLVNWINEKEFYFETVGDSEGTALYKDRADHNATNRLVPTVLEKMQDAAKEKEEAILLVLFASDDPEAAEDRWLNDVIEAVVPAGFPCFALNDGMVEITIEDDDDAAADTDTQSERPNLQAVPDPEPEQDGSKEYQPVLTREYLEGLQLSDLKKLAAERGIDVPPRSRTATYIDRLLDDDGEPEAEVTPPLANEGLATRENAYREDLAVQIESTVSTNGDTAQGVTTARTMVLLIHEGLVTSVAVDPSTFQRVMDVLT